MREFVLTGRVKVLALVTATAAAAAVAGIAALPAHAAHTVARAGHGPVFTSHTFASGDKITHNTPSGSETISNPDDITSLNHRIYVGFQNGVGPQGEPSTTGNRDSTVVAFNRLGRAVAKWNIVGKCDGLTADTQTGKVIATVNEDAHSSIYLINPHGAAVHYDYNVALPSKGGTDAISVYRGIVLISASAPGTTGTAAPQPTYPAIYRATFNSATHVAKVRALFYDEAHATIANLGSTHGDRVKLALTDPDSNEDVPSFAARFAGDFMLTSQGDKQQIFVKNAGTRHQSLSVLNLSSSVDDTAWPSDRHGAIYTTDNGNNTIYKITGSFTRGSVLVADTPCDENGAPSTCPGPGFPANFLGKLNPFTGAITRVNVVGPAVQAQGMLFLP
jgi:hypothetical protein